MATEEQNRLEEQIAYYRARASEYDEWFLRQGRYARGEEHSRQWFAEVAQVQQAFADFGPRGRILELACGTGWWTEQLEPYAETLVAVDTSPEVIALNQQRVDSEKVTYLEANIFELIAAGQLPAGWAGSFNVVFFSFWLSHVPPEQFDGFWGLVQKCLRPEGRVFFIDSLYNEMTTAHNQPLGRLEETTSLRRLNDGRTFEIVKVYYDPAELAERLGEMGWKAEVKTTAESILYGSAERSVS